MRNLNAGLLCLSRVTRYYESLYGSGIETCHPSIPYTRKGVMQKWHLPHNRMLCWPILSSTDQRASLDICYLLGLNG